MFNAILYVAIAIVYMTGNHGPDGDRAVFDGFVGGVCGALACAHAIEWHRELARRRR